MRPTLGDSSMRLDQFFAQGALLVAVQLLLELAEHVVVGVEQEPAGAGGRVADAVVRRRLHDLADRLDHGAGREVLAGAA